MKSNFSILLGCSIAVIGFFACQPTTPPANAAEKKLTATNPNKRLLTIEDTISLNTFNLWTSNWQQSRNNPPYVEYFTMENIDLSEVLREAPDKVAYYMGLDNATRPATPHLILVGLKQTGIVNGVPEYKKMLDEKNGEYAYDVTIPCPSGCPVKQ